MRWTHRYSSACRTLFGMSGNTPLGSPQSQSVYLLHWPLQQIK
jgi:hypothetical protein